MSGNASGQSQDETGKVSRSDPRFMKISATWVALSLVLPFALCAVAPIYYLEPDDSAMNYIANGSLGNTYVGPLIYIQYLLSAPVAMMFRLVPGINWLLVLLLGTLAISFGMLCHCAFRWNVPWHANAILLVMETMLAWQFLTYTAVGLMAIASGVVAMATFYRVRSESPLTMVGGALLVMLGFCLRGDCLLPATIVSVPLLAYALMEKRGKELIWRREVAFAIMLVALVGGCRLIHLQAYSSEPWKLHTDYNDARTHAIDYPLPAYEERRDEFLRLGLSEAEYEMLASWQFSDLDVFDAGTLRAIGDIARSSTDVSDHLRMGVGQIAPLVWVPIGVVICAVLALVFSRDVRQRQFVTLGALVTLGVLLGLAFVRLRFVIRAALPLALIFVVVSLFMAGSDESDRTDRSRPHLLLTALPLCVVTTMLLLYSPFSITASDCEAYCQTAELRDHIAEHEDTVFVMSSGPFNNAFRGGIPCQEIHVLRTPNVLKTGGWDSFSPRFVEGAEACGIDARRILCAPAQGNVRYIGTSVEPMRTYLEEQLGTSVTVVSDLGFNAFHVYEFDTGV